MAKSDDTLHRMVETLEDDILFGRLRTRERLIEDELIERFGATRHAVRQGLAELERMGMVVRLKNRGAVVRDFSRAEVEEICAVREMLHAQAAALIPMPADPTLVRRLEKLHEAHSREVERGNLRGIHQANSAFHDALFDACGNRYLTRTIGEYAQMSLAFRCHVMVNPFLARRARDEHAAMIQALKRGDRARLVRLCTHHTQAAKEVYFSLQGFADAGGGRREPPATAATRAGSPGRRAALAPARKRAVRA